jgi:hypothetical protein
MQYVPDLACKFLIDELQFQFIQAVGAEAVFIVIFNIAALLSGQRHSSTLAQVYRADLTFKGGTASSTCLIFVATHRIIIIREKLRTII